MKKFALIIVTMAYMLSIAGIAISRFYCCGKLSSESISFIGGKQKEASDAAGCCTTSEQYFKIKDAHIFADHIACPEKYFSFIQTTLPSFEIPTSEILQHATTGNINAPPLKTENPVYIFICTYRI